MTHDMDIRIRTGFQAISHSIKFNPETLLKGKALAVCHVVRVEELQSNGVSVIRGSVIRQTSISLTPYKVVLQLNSQRHVTSVSCTCVSQAGENCKHIYSLIYYINSDTSSSKTSIEQEWGKPSDAQLAKEMYAKGILICEVFKTKTITKQTEVVPYPVQLSDLSEACALRSYLRESSRTEGETAARQILHDIIDRVVTSSSESMCKACTQMLTISAENTDLYLGHSIARLDQTLLEFYKNAIMLTEDQIIDLCIKTIKQSKSEEWVAARYCRISESSKAHLIKIRKKKSIESLVFDFLNSTELKGAAKKNIEYGNRNEIIAKSEYESRFGVKVLSIGLLVLLSQPWLCASPDGIVLEDGVITKLLEIKCPSSCSTASIIDPVTKEINVPYLYASNDVIKLKRSSQYYTQCQIQLYVAGQTVCDLYIWSPEGSCLVTVYRDEIFLEEVIPKLEEFYFNHYLKAVYEKQK